MSQKLITLAQLQRSIADLLHVRPQTVAQYARHLREAGLLPKGKAGRSGVGAAPADATSLVRLIIALAAADRPSNAPDAVRLFGGLPARMSILSAPNGIGQEIMTSTAIEDVYIPYGGGDKFNSYTRNFHDALIRLITESALIAEITFWRSPEFPQVLVRLVSTDSSMPGWSNIIIYAPPDTVGRYSQLAHQTTVPGNMLSVLASAISAAPAQLATPLPIVVADTVADPLSAVKEAR